ncbi:ionotropic receptor 75a-like [Haematobia irritans]|uniref:ionotropic receptor 75a-like n=1 Tax=Haematobia irritans TaxID=7368 RepID=UPI003F50AEFD
MVNIALFNFILYNFLENHIKWAIIFNCWKVNSQIKLTEIFMDHNIYVKLWDINHVTEQDGMEDQFLGYTHPHVGIFFDINCLKSEEILNKASKEKLFTEHFHWLIYDGYSDMEKFRYNFQNFNMAVDADLTYSFPNPKKLNTKMHSFYQTYDVYNNGYNWGGTLNMTADQEIACTQKKCQRNLYLSTLYQKRKYENRWHLRDITLRVSTVATSIPVTETPNIILKFLNSDDKRYIDAIARFGFAHLMVLKDTLMSNFSYSFTNAWSETETTGGVIGAICIENSAELASSPFLPTLKRNEYCKPTVALGGFRHVCIFRTPRNSGVRGKVYFKPFSTAVWIYFAVVIILAAPLLWITFKVESAKLRKNLTYIPSLLTSGLIAFGSVCCQGSFLVPQSVGGRITFFSLSLLTYIIYNYYTSIVVAILLGTPAKSNINTLKGLAESNLKMGIDPIPHTMSYLNFSKRPEVRSIVRNKIQSRKDPESVWIPITEGLKRVREEPGFVYITDSYSSYDMIERTYTANEICDLNEILLRHDHALYLHINRNSSYKEFLKLKQYRILESGVHSRIENMWFKSRLPCYASTTALLQVGWEYTAPLFIMIACIYALAFIILILEIFWFKYFTTRYLHT